LLAALAAFATLGLGCQAVGGLTDAERNQLCAGERVVVLLRLECAIDGQPAEPFGEEEFAGAPIFGFGLGSFETVLEPVPIAPRMLASDSERGGWIYLFVAPGTYHFAVLGPDSNVISMQQTISRSPLTHAPRWHMDVPDEATIVYAGTLSFEAKSTGELLFGGRTIQPDPGGTVSVRDEFDEAKLVADRHFPAVERVTSVLLRRWRPGDTKLLRTPRELRRRAARAKEIRRTSACGYRA
jgi:hypothetical protein